MAELATIARPYAEALFRVAKAGTGTTTLNAWSELVSELAQVAAHPDVQALSHNPKVLDSQVADTILAAVKTPLNAEAKNFVNMLVENGRVTLLPEIGAQFQALKLAQEGAADAAIASAFELSSAQVDALVATLEKRFARKLNPVVTVDSTLIGGVRVVVGDEVLDTSVCAKLQQMHVALTA
jgi:F-type H+-transporting ATPase subunit delta